MNPQDELFHEDWRDALLHTVKALGGYDTVGKDLWPSKGRKAAGRWLFDCLNEDRPAKLDLDDIQSLIQMGRERGCYTAMHILCDLTSYERPKPSTPKSPKTQLLEKQASLAAQMAHVNREIDRIDGADEARRLRAAS